MLIGVSPNLGVRAKLRNGCSAARALLFLRMTIWKKVGFFVLETPVTRPALLVLVSNDVLEVGIGVFSQESLN